MSSFRKLTGKKRHRSATIKNREFLILQLEEQDYIVEFPGVGRDIIYWRDATTADVTTTPDQEDTK